jgi:hypothetical protein
MKTALMIGSTGLLVPLIGTTIRQTTMKSNFFEKGYWNTASKVDTTCYRFDKPKPKKFNYWR